MKRSSRPRKTAKLSDSTHQLLNLYTIAAGAAGVSLLALTQPAVARIVYTPAHVRIGAFDLDYTLDLNHDGHGDFILLNATSCNSSFCKAYLSIEAPAGNAVEGVSHGYPAAFALTRGMRVGSESHLGGRAVLLDVLYFGGQRYCFAGYWCNVENRYLGLAFKIKGRLHYGWARLNVSFGHDDGVNAILTGFAYETVPGKSIKAGQT